MGISTRPFSTIHGYLNEALSAPFMGISTRPFSIIHGYLNEALSAPFMGISTRPFSIIHAGYLNEALSAPFMGISTRPSMYHIEGVYAAVGMQGYLNKAVFLTPTLSSRTCHCCPLILVSAHISQGNPASTLRF